MEPEKPKSQLTDQQRAQIERNRQHALLLKQSRPVVSTQVKPDECITRFENSKLVDSGGGFYIEVSALQNNDSLNGSNNQPTPIYPEVPPIFQPNLDITKCTDCGKKFHESFLLTTFDVLVCNDCRNEETHALITKSEAKNEYLLKDVDLDSREPKLKYLLRKNPHNSRWGSMKLYLRCQVAERAIEVWGSEEALEEEKVNRGEKRVLLKRKKFEKSVKELRMAVRSSTYTKDLGSHQHQYGEEVYNEAEDNYCKSCSTCGHILTYEQM